MRIILDPDTLVDVYTNVNESFYSDQVAASDYGDETSGLVYTIGQTRRDVLYGVEENGYGQHVAYRFADGAEQLEWFVRASHDILTA